MLSKLLQQAAGNAGGTLGYVEDVFSTYLYTGDSSTDRNINNGIDLDGEGGLIWGRARDNTDGHVLIDTERGAGKILRTHLASAEYTDLGSIDSFNPDGYHIAGNASNINNSSYDYVSWTFRKAKKFFDVVTYTGDGTAGRQIPHNLGCEVGMIIVKRIDSSTYGSWVVTHRFDGITEKSLHLNETEEAFLAERLNIIDENVFEVSDGTTWSGTSNGSTNISGAEYVAYLFAHDAGGFGDDGSESIIKCGSYTGNGSSAGPTVTLGYEPQWLLVKPVSNTGGAWQIGDVMRNMSLTNFYQLRANYSDAELNTTTPYFAPTPTGFQVVNSSAEVNGNGWDYIYIAIRRGPMKTPTSGTEVFYPTGSGLPSTVVTTGFPSDVVWQYTDTSAGFLAESRIIGDSRRLQIPSTAAETTSLAWAAFSLSSMNLMTQTYFNYLTVSNLAGYAFRRAPGFFDVVAYTGTGVARIVNHNLGVAPELMIVKRRDGSGNWCVYHSSLGGTKNLYLQSPFGQQTISGMWNDTDPTSTVFTVGNESSVNYATGTYVAYLFATLSGISKVGSYTGTGTTLQIDCGFTGGARFVLIKRTDSTGDWYVWDSARGIVAGNDPYLLLNSTAAEVTSTDYIDPYSAGFEISSTAPADINASSGTFIYLAIA